MISAVAKEEEGGWLHNTTKDIVRRGSNTCKRINTFILTYANFPPNALLCCIFAKWYMDTALAPHLQTLLISDISAPYTGRDIGHPDMRLGHPP